MIILISILLGFIINRYGTEFYKDCVNLCNIINLCIFIFLPYVFRNRWTDSIICVIIYISTLILIWILIKKGILKIKKRVK